MPEGASGIGSQAGEVKHPLNSLTLKSAAAMAVAFAAHRIGLHMPDGAARDIASALVDLVFALGLAGVGIGRARAHAPIGGGGL